MWILNEKVVILTPKEKRVLPLALHFEIGIKMVSKRDP
jgi:hypothetical protein